jgi:hypothetical protein
MQENIFHFLFGSNLLQLAATFASEMMAVSFSIGSTRITQAGQD